MVYYHGTNIDLEIGDVLLPGSLLSSSNHGRSDHVYLTTDTRGASDEYAVREAYIWARVACMVASNDNENQDFQAYVYIVEPLDDVEADASEDVGNEAVRTSRAVIVDVVDAYDLEVFAPSVGNSYLNL